MARRRARPACDPTTPVAREIGCFDDLLRRPNLCLLKTLKCQEILAIAGPQSYRRCHDHGSFCSGFPRLTYAH
jgi:hypothetical protein